MSKLERIATFCGQCNCGCPELWIDPDAPDEQRVVITRVVITNDSDFGELVFRQGMPHSGVIYLRFPLDSTADQKIASIAQFLAARPEDVGRFVVLTPSSVRIGDADA